MTESNKAPIDKPGDPAGYLRDLEDPEFEGRVTEFHRQHPMTGPSAELLDRSGPLHPDVWEEAHKLIPSTRLREAIWVFYREASHTKPNDPRLQTFRDTATLSDEKLAELTHAERGILYQYCSDFYKSLVDERKKSPDYADRMAIMDFLKQVADAQAIEAPESAAMAAREVINRSASEADLTQPGDRDIA
jgi:hypothetical protein